MCIRDRALIDLVDNSIDAARNQLKNEGGEENFSKFKIELSLKENEFIIKDNCGGFSLEVAKKYALRIGRPRWL